MSRSYLGVGIGQCGRGTTQDRETSVRTAPEAGGTGQQCNVPGQREASRG